MESLVHLAAASRLAQGIPAELLHAAAAAQSLQEASVRGAAGATSRHRRPGNERESAAKNRAAANDKQIQSGEVRVNGQIVSQRTCSGEKYIDK